jgi:hypothetical protein
MGLLTGQKPHNLAADLPAGARHRDTHHALPVRLGELEPDGYIRPQCPFGAPAAIRGRDTLSVPSGGSARGYQAIFVASATLGSPGYDGQPAAYLYITALEVNVLN